MRDDKKPRRRVLDWFNESGMSIIVGSHDWKNFNCALDRFDIRNLIVIEHEDKSCGWGRPKKREISYNYGQIQRKLAKRESQRKAIRMKKYHKYKTTNDLLLELLEIRRQYPACFSRSGRRINGALEEKLTQRENQIIIYKEVQDIIAEHPEIFKHRI